MLGTHSHDLSVWSLKCILAGIHVSAGSPAQLGVQADVAREVCHEERSQGQACKGPSHRQEQSGPMQLQDEVPKALNWHCLQLRARCQLETKGPQ